MVLAVVVTICGILALFTLPAGKYPEVAPPQITVSAQFPGADAETLLNSVVEPLEQQINGAADMIYMKSTASNSGSAVITVTFRTGTDSETALQNVRARVSRAEPRLPEAVRKQGVVTREQSGSILLAIALRSGNGAMNSLELANYAETNLSDELKRVPGIAEVSLYGGSPWSFRVWFDNAKLASLGLSPQDAVRAIEEQNTVVSSGAAGASPSAPGTAFRFSIKTGGRLRSSEEFRKIVLRADRNGACVRLGDVARVELGAEEYTTSGSLKGRPAAVLVLYRRPGANGLATAKGAESVMKRLSARFPAGMSWEIQYDSTQAVRLSIRDVVRTLLLAVLLVAGVVFLFLQDWRMAAVPLLAIPVSILGSFAVLKAAGFSLNLVTLFALILAIGIVVDDAIIVIENIHRLIRDEKLRPRDAAVKSMSQITGAVLATTAVLLAMFLPICFLPGITGALYRQFGVTISAAVTISAFNALTLSPALGAMFLRHDPDRIPNRFERGFNAVFGMIAGGYRKSLSGFLNHPVTAGTAFVLFSLAVFWWFSKLPGGFIPEEDSGAVFVSVKLPQNASLERTEAACRAASESFARIPGVKDVLAIAGLNAVESVPESDSAFLLVVLDGWEKRLDRGLSIGRELEAIQRASFAFPQAFYMAFLPPAIPGIGLSGGFNFMLRNLSGDWRELESSYDAVLERASASPKLRNVFSVWNPEETRIVLTLDRVKAMASGVSVKAVNDMLSASTGALCVNDFNRGGRVYRVFVQSEQRYRDLERELNSLYVAGTGGAQVPLASLVKLSRETAPESLTRFNLRLCVPIEGEPAPGFSSGEAMDEMRAIARETLPPSADFEWSGMSFQQAEAGNAAPYVFALALLFIYLFLAALYESWILPLAVVLTVPFVFPGALILLNLSGIAGNLYTKIGLLLLFGMACKTAILIADFAVRSFRSGTGMREAAEEGANLRFRAIVMTASAFIFGTLPLVFAEGPSAMSQRSIGCCAAGGMALAVPGLLYYAPLFFLGCAKFLRGRAGK